MGREAMRRDGWLRALFGLIYPERPQCVLCQLPFVSQEEAVCPVCIGQVQRLEPPFCHICGRELGKVQGVDVCLDCGRRGAHFFLRAVAYGRYEGMLRRMLWKVKKDGHTELLPHLAHLLEQAFAAELFSCGIEGLVPVPMAEATLRERGFNQAEELAVQVGQRVGVPVFGQALRWDGAGRGQWAKSREQRLIGVEDSVQVGAGAEELLYGKTVCLVDDVYTTGATANACAMRLLEAGAQAVYVLTVAR